MSRYRPPHRRASPYITRAGHQALQAELRRLWEDERPAVRRRVQEAAGQGDRSENAEYTYGKRQLGQIDSRVRYLTRRLEEVTIVDRPPEDRNRVYFGARVTVEDNSGWSHHWRIVGADELYPQRGWISIDAPAARALIGKQMDDEVRVQGPDGPRTYVITEIRYDFEA